MKRLILLALISAIFGCQPTETPKAEPVVTAPAPSNPGGGVTPMTSGVAGGMTPMAGTESLVGGSGGGVGQAAKDQARRSADAAQNSGSPAEETGV